MEKYLRLQIVALTVILLSACGTTYPNRSPIGEVFPLVIGESLEEENVTLPVDFKGKPTLLILGYVQDAQFDIDRWLIGLEMTDTRVDTYEVPTIKGMFPRFFKTQINQGMRNGIPKELWKGVITIYRDGDSIQQFTGNSNPNNGRVVLLDKDGKIAYFYDRGFSVESLKRLKLVLAVLVDDE